MAREIIDRIGEHACFPYAYILGFLQFLQRRRNAIDIVTYADFAWNGDNDFQNFYPTEYAEWKQSLVDGRRSAKKAYVLIQHDVDNVPHRTHSLMKDEAEFGMRSNVMLFHERPQREILAKRREIVVGNYDVDWDLCRRLQQEMGFVFGYHANAFERALFDPIRAAELFREDVEQMRGRLPIHFFSPHGGVRSDKGETNVDWIAPGDCRGELRWVHNRFGCRFDGNWSDGGPNGKRDPRERDLRDFVRTWQPGKRYRVLLHPQYYDSDFKLSRRYLQANWYRGITQRAERQWDYDPWEQTDLLWAA